MNKYKVLDLFSGCGGISLGFQQTGKFEIVGGIEVDKQASETFAKNFPNAKVINDDIRKVEINENNFGKVDIIVGGPPCQGFSALNRWNKGLDEDPRNKLFYEFLRIAGEVNPKIILIENVRQILTSKDGYAKNRIIELLEKEGYKVDYKVLDASDFGVPQNRKRAFFVGIKKELGNFDFNCLDKHHLNKVTVWEALSDIYKIENIAKDNKEGNGNTLGEPESEYQNKLREGNILNSHFVYYPTESVHKKIIHVSEGENWKSVPEELFKSIRNNRHSNYLKRLDSSSQSVTIDTGHNVYFHPKLHRVPTVRESARLQSFPDDFEFTGNKGAQFRQVGNAVPPLLAEGIAKGLLDVLETKKTYKLIDLFCGAGGLSLGFEREEFHPELAIDFCEKAIQTYNHNRENKVGKVFNIKNINEEFLKEYIEKDIDGIIGGPPCQGFSTAGRRIVDDERNELYRDYFKTIEIVKPKFFVMENVAGIMTMLKGLIKKDILERGKSLGYEMFFETLLASDYGIPQNRKRVFFVGIRKDCYKGEFNFPSKTEELVTIEDAISDLPSLDREEDNRTYNKSPLTRFQAEMRQESTTIYNHDQTAHTEETKKMIALVPEGGSIQDIPEEHRGGRKYKALLRRMKRDVPSHTIDTGHRTYFHYEEKRIHSVREGARLQTFPDTYEFKGAKGYQYKQVGNAVPPKLSQVIAKEMKKYFEK